MDSQLATRLFRQLYRRHHPLCQPRRNLAHLTATLQNARLRQLSRPCQRRRFATRRPTKTAIEEERNWQQRQTFLPEDRMEEYEKYPMVTADDLRARTERPRRVKMLMRDFIEDSLYNPSYGYFSKQAVIFTPGDPPFDFPSMASNPDFIAQLGQRYTAFEDALDAANAATDTEPAGTPSRTRQLWHTPSELFSPHYGYAVARYLASNYLLTWYPYHDLVIYELGGGRGTLMKNVLDYLRAADPAVYARTRARIVEVSPQLAKIQRRTLAEAGHGKDTVEIVPKSILDWDTPVPEPCFIVAMEVFDNLAHDCVRYDLTGSSRHSDNDDSNSGRRQRRLVGGGASSQGHGDPQPLQCVVLIDSRGDFYEFYTPHLDPVLSRFLRVRHAATGGHYPVPFATGRLERLWEKCRLWLFPFAPNLSRPEYVPTRLMQLFDVLDRYFPQHKLLAADFHELPNAIEGLNAPVVQTRFDRRTVPVSTPLVHQGYFDILFPTDFAVSEAIYRAITGRLTRALTHEDFMRRWAYLEDTRTRSGENPLLSWYRNHSVLYTV